MSGDDRGVRPRPDYGPEVRRFAAQMRRKLRLNRDKDGWLGDGDKAWLLDKVDEEVAELKRAIEEGNLPGQVEEAGDVANVVLILALLVPGCEWPEVEVEDLDPASNGEAALLAAVIRAKADGARIEAEGMIAFNEQRIQNGLSPGYCEEAFGQVLERWGIAPEKLDEIFARLTMAQIIRQGEGPT